MTGKAINNSATGCLILILPIAFLMTFVLTTWPILLALVVVGTGWNAWQGYRWQKWCQQVNPVFHQLIQENQGSITALDLAMKANFSADIAKRYLDTKAKEFGAQRRDEQDHRTVYYFITSKTLGSLLDSSEPPRQIESKTSLTHTAINAAESLEPIVQEQPKQKQPESPTEVDEEQAKLPLHKQLVFGSLIQSELARRLDVHSSTIYKRRDDTDFSEWSRTKDPDGIAWKYSPDTKEFFPLLEESS